MSEFSSAQIRAVLGGMRAVAATPGPEALTDADRASLSAAWRYIFRQPGPAPLGDLPPITPQALAEALPERGKAEEAMRFLAVMAFVDGALDPAKIAAALAYAAALRIEGAYLTEMTEAAAGHLGWALADMGRRNIESVSGKPWTSDDVIPWIMPYRDGHADPALAARYATLQDYPPGTLGRAFWLFYQKNGYAFPGTESGLNAIFAAPHDCAHILTGYDTTARGELLVSTFTASMHRSYPMAGHVLPVLFSWHLGLQINPAAGAVTGALDPEEFWRAWALGAGMEVDLFGGEWSLWDWAGEDLDAMRARHLPQV